MELVPFLVRRQRYRACIAYWDADASFLAAIPRTDHRSDALVLSPFSQRAFERLVTRTDAAIAGFSARAGAVEAQVFSWKRLQPRDPMADAEWQGITQEMRLRAQEALRSRGWGTGSLTGIGTVVHEVRCDGRRVLNPLGFAGKTLSLRVSHYFLFPEAAQWYLRLAASSAPRFVSPLFVDDALTRFVSPTHPSARIVFEEHVTTLLISRSSMRMKRITLSFGLSSLFNQAARTLMLDSGATLREALFSRAGQTNEGARRKMKAAFLAALLAWLHRLFSLAPLKDFPQQKFSSVLFVPVAMSEGLCFLLSSPSVQRSLAKEFKKGTFRIASLRSCTSSFCDEEAPADDPRRDTARLVWCAARAPFPIMFLPWPFHAV